MDERIKEKLITRAKTNPYVNFLGIDFTVIEEGRVEAHMPLHDEQRQYSGCLLYTSQGRLYLPSIGIRYDLYDRGSESDRRSLTFVRYVSCLLYTSRCV